MLIFLITALLNIALIFVFEKNKGFVIQEHLKHTAESTINNDLSRFHGQSKQQQSISIKLLCGRTGADFEPSAHGRRYVRFFFLCFFLPFLATPATSAASVTFTCIITAFLASL
jgi:hypothetical protein